MSDCNQMNCHGAYTGNRRMSAMRQTRSSAYTRNAGGNAGYDGSLNSSSSCRDAVSLSDLPLAMGYVPRQVWQDIYEPEKALMHGTIFAQLYKPFCGVRGGRRA